MLHVSKKGERAIMRTLQRWHRPSVPPSVPLLAALLLATAVSAVSFAPQVASAAPRAHMTAAQPAQWHIGPSVRLSVRPGQDVTVPFPLTGDPGATLRITLSRPSSFVPGHVGKHQASTAYTPGCYYGIKETESAYDVYGVTLYWFAITTDFCFDGTNVTYLTNPPSQSWGSCCFWGIGAHGSSISGLYTPYGQSKGDAHFSGPFWQSDHLWVLINTYGDGNYAGGGGSN